jgi:hypothetical protein
VTFSCLSGFFQSSKQQSSRATPQHRPSSLRTKLSLRVTPPRQRSSCPRKLSLRVTPPRRRSSGPRRLSLRAKRSNLSAGEESTSPKNGSPCRLQEVSQEYLHSARPLFSLAKTVIASAAKQSPARPAGCFSKKRLAVSPSGSFSGATPPLIKR